MWSASTGMFYTVHMFVHDLNHETHVPYAF